MKQIIANIFCFSFIFYLFLLDRKRNERVSRAIWVPILWVLVPRLNSILSLFHLKLPFIYASASTDIEGNPLFNLFYSLLIIIGIKILYRKKNLVISLLGNNKVVWLYFVYGLISLFWSEYPFVSLKRLIKSSGNLIMVLIVITETQPYVALGAVIKRLSFILLPLSFLYIKFYPYLGRAYHMGKPMFTGVFDQKNALGAMCFVSGVYFSWNLLLEWKKENKIIRHPYFIYLSMVPLIIWLLYVANSTTSTICTSIAFCIIFFSRQTLFRNNPKSIIVFTFSGIFLFGIMELIFGIKDEVFEMLGRSGDLTGRVEIWENYLSLVTAPIIGYGYETFYTTVIMQNKVSEFVPAHNGYLEMYLNLGLIGLIFILSWIVSGINKIWNYITIDYSEGVFRFTILLTILIYSWSEVVFSGASFLWILFFVVILKKDQRLVAKNEF